MKRIFLFVALIVSLSVSGQRGYDNNNVSFYGTNARGLATALAAVNNVVIDKDITIDSVMAIPTGKIVSFMNGAVITADSLLTIQGQIWAQRERIFASNAKIKFAQYSRSIIYPEWFGAKPMQDCRDTAVSSTAIDCSDALEAAVNCFESIHYPTNNEFTSQTIVLSGVYGVTRKLTIKNKTVKFVGSSPYFNGTGFRFIGTLTGDSAQAYVIEFDGANASGMENVCIKGKRTTNDAVRMLGAINMICSPGGTPQRHLMFHHVWIGDRLGNWGDQQVGYEFENGWSCGTTGLELNNDFFGFYDIGVGNTRVGILNSLNMAVNWTIDKYSFGYGETMISYPNGGMFTGREWYPALTTDGGYLIKCGDNSGTTTRFEIYNWDSEHLPSDGLVWGNGTIRATFTNGHINVDGLGAAGDGFKMLGGDANIYDPIMEFNHITFLLEGTQKAYFDCSDASGSRGYFKFMGCTSTEGLWFKMPLSQSRATMFINIDGRKPASDADVNLFTRYSLNNSHPDIDGSGFISLYTLIGEGSTEVPASNIITGKRGYELYSETKRITRFRASAAENTTTLGLELPANAIIEEVTVAFHESGVLASGGYVKVGYAGNDEAFGRITGTSAFIQNNKNAASLVLSTATPIVLKSFNSSNVAVNMAAGKYMVISIAYKEVGKGVSEISVNALGLLPVDGAE